MKLAKIVFPIAGIWGILVHHAPLFMFNLIGRQDPPPITHPGFYYGFVAAALAWQIAFFVIARDPIRLRPLMVPAVIEKFGYGIAVVVLVLQNRMHTSDLVFGCVDLLLGALFVAAFVKARSS